MQTRVEGGFHASGGGIDEFIITQTRTGEGLTLQRGRLGEGKVGTTKGMVKLL